jgi:hypothetical protein
MNNDVNVPLFGIRFRMFSGLPDPHPDPFVRGTNTRIRIRIRIRTKMSRTPSTRHHFDAEPGPTFHFDADLDPYPTSSYTQVWKTDFLLLFTAMLFYMFYLSRQCQGVIIFRTVICTAYGTLLKFSGLKHMVPVVYLYIGWNECRSGPGSGSTGPGCRSRSGKMMPIRPDTGPQDCYIGLLYSTTLNLPPPLGLH